MEWGPWGLGRRIPRHVHGHVDLDAGAVWVLRAVRAASVRVVVRRLLRDDLRIRFQGLPADLMILKPPENTLNTPQSALNRPKVYNTEARSLQPRRPGEVSHGVGILRLPPGIPDLFGSATVLRT